MDVSNIIFDLSITRELDVEKNVQILKYKVSQCCLGRLNLYFLEDGEFVLTNN